MFQFMTCPLFLDLCELGCLFVIRHENAHKPMLCHGAVGAKLQANRLGANVQLEIDGSPIHYPSIPKSGCSSVANIVEKVCKIG